MDTVPVGRRLVVRRLHQLRRRKPNPMRTICQVLRELHEDATARGDTVSMARIDEAFDMAKRMQYKLEQYRPGAPYIVVGGEQERTT